MSAATPRTICTFTATAMAKKTKPARLSGLRMPISSHNDHAAKAIRPSTRRRKGASGSAKCDISKVKKAPATKATAPTFAFKELVRGPMIELIMFPVPQPRRSQPRFRSYSGSSRLPRKLLILQPVRDDAVLPQPPHFVFLVVLEVAFEPLDVAVALERHSGITHVRAQARMRASKLQ